LYSVKHGEFLNGEELLTSQEGLCCRQLVDWLVC
jgi:hypothetical protein